MKSAIADEICFADEIKFTHRRSDFIRPQGGFHRQRRFHPPIRVDLVEKPTCRNKSVFLVRIVGVARLRTERWRGKTVHRTVFLHAPFDPHYLSSLIIKTEAPSSLCFNYVNGLQKRYFVYASRIGLNPHKRLYFLTKW